MGGYSDLIREESDKQMCPLLFHLAKDPDAKANNGRNNIL